jgi:tRNA 2-selenouridine synthase
LKRFREEKLLLLDARSPSEFNQAHIPGAVSFPLLNDEQRKEVGITYKLKGREAAVVKGFDLVGSAFGDFVRDTKKLQSSLKINKDAPVMIYCWRGGMRSGIMSWVLSTAGYEIILLDDGYKAYRNYVLDLLSRDKKLVILGGKTGSGKTETLEQLRRAGEQVICLETLANHRGSAFGALGMGAQPRNEQFENILAEEWEAIDETKIVWLENESQSIGSIVLQKKFFEKMRNAPVVEMIVSKEMRIQNILKEYGKFPVGELIDNTRKIEQRLGGLRTKQAIDALQEGNLKQWVDVVLFYYDKAYEYGINIRSKDSVLQVEIDADDTNEMKIKKLIEASRNLMSEENKTSHVRATTIFSGNI